MSIRVKRARWPRLWVCLECGLFITGTVLPDLLKPSRTLAQASDHTGISIELRSPNRQPDHSIGKRDIRGHRCAFLYTNTSLTPYAPSTSTQPFHNCPICITFKHCPMHFPVRRSNSPSCPIGRMWTSTMHRIPAIIHCQTRDRCTEVSDTLDISSESRTEQKR
ncbi:hypothetical protein OBBRIDRAFT_788375 [Obba rivulosa]|uniref:Uncharacterized protein n=1 Tax=Obba rivulosa TaxID=1052685 RepID=A0A8E2DTD7_9APHY|nr:hypothetical protein OBBRIDRAFT_788375 [Obba rivulosa]